MWAIGALVALSAAIASPANAQTAPEPGPGSTTATTVAPSGPTVQAIGVSGFVANEKSQPLAGICVAFYVSATSVPAGSTLTLGDGSWSSPPSIVAGPSKIVAFRPTVVGDCTSAPKITGPVPEWYADVAVTVPLTPPAAPPATDVADNTTNVAICLGRTTLYSGTCTATPRPSGTGVISGIVVKTGALPVDQACVLAYLADPAVAAYVGITDAQGKYSITGLPIGRLFVVGALPPFNVGQGPCVLPDGPLPTFAAGELQPVWFAGVWLNTAAAALDSNPYTYAVSVGATAVADGATAIDACLSNAAGTVVPRPACTAAVTVVTAAAATATTIPAASLAHTGSQDPVTPAAFGAVLIALGVAFVIGARRRAAGST